MSPPPLSTFIAKNYIGTNIDSDGLVELPQHHEPARRGALDTMRNNLRGIPTDTPNVYEKNSSTATRRISAEIFMLNLDAHELFSKVDARPARTQGDGEPLVITPNSATGESGHHAAVAFGLRDDPRWLLQYSSNKPSRPDRAL